MNHFFEYAQEIGCKASRQEPMSRHISFKAGGPAELFLEPANEGMLSKLLRYAADHGIKTHVIGNGSNLLVPDTGVHGAVIKIGDALSDLVMLDETTIRCGAGVSLTKLCTFAQAHGLTGLEFAYGIPGSAGGAAYMNAGAYGGEMKDVLTSCSHVGPDGSQGLFSGEELELGYRKSAYTDSGIVITNLVISLEKGDRDAIKSKMQELMQRRKDKQPLEYPSAGSTFKRPEGHYAGALIEQCGLKGKKVGGAQVSEKHAGFVINAGGATCSDILELIAYVKRTVLEKTGVKLELEVKILQ